MLDKIGRKNRTYRIQSAEERRRNAVEAHCGNGALVDVPLHKTRKKHHCRRNARKRTRNQHRQDDIAFFTHSAVLCRIAVQSRCLYLITEFCFFKNDPNNDCNYYRHRYRDRRTFAAEDLIQSETRKQLPAIRRWLGSDQVYTVRYGIGMLMRYYLDDAFRPEYLAWVAAVHSEEYYVNMMRAWYFATALAKQPAAALPWLTEKRLDVWTHNKTIQKAVESYRIPPEQKQSLRALRIRSQKLCEERRV